MTWNCSSISEDLHRFARKIVFVIVSEQFYYRNNNKNNFVSICCKFLSNLCKSSEILEHCHVKWWRKYRNNRSVSWRLSCKTCTNYNLIHMPLLNCYRSKLTTPAQKFMTVRSMFIVLFYLLTQDWNLNALPKYFSVRLLPFTYSRTS